MIDQLSQTIREAATRRRMLAIRGGGTKDFYGGPLRGDPLSVCGHRGVVAYEPSELVMTARCGTPLGEVERVLTGRGQMLAFEPPHFGPEATLGGCIASGLSGPRRAYCGAARDFVLGVRMVDGKGSDLSFGGQVMKNVAGYDVSRLMVGSLGTLGVLLEVSLKVLPLPACEITLRQHCPAAKAIDLMNAWAGKPLPLSATCHVGDQLYVRLSGAEAAVRAARRSIGGEDFPDGSAFWHAVREQELDFFRTADPLWRVSVKSTTPPLDLPGEQMIEWGGALRWVRTGAGHEAVRSRASSGGGHATLFRNGDRSAGVFQPLPPALAQIHRRLQQTFDPAGIFNSARLYEWT